MTLEALFLRFLLLSLSGGAAVLLLRLAKPLLRHWDPRWQVWLWLLLALRMLLPLALPQSPAKAVPLPPLTFFALPAREVVLLPTAENLPSAAAAPGIAPLQWAAMVWLAGIAVFLLWHGLLYHREKRRIFRNAVPAAAAELAHLQRLARELQCVHSPALLNSAAALCPLAIGLLRPCIVLPLQGGYTADDLDFILRHELCHLRTGHLWQKALLLPVNALHWFNPALWLLRHEAGVAMELCCDAAVAQNLNLQQRAAYAQALLRAAVQEHRFTTLSTNWNGGTREMKTRLRTILAAKPKRTFAIGLAALLCTALAITAAGVGPALLRADRNAPVAEDSSAVVQQEDGSKYNTETDGQRTPPVGLGTLLRPLPAAASEILCIYEEGVPLATEDGDILGAVYYVNFTHNKHTLAGADDIRAVQSGKVARVYTDAHFGLVVELDHGNGYTSSYGNCKSASVQAGETVAAGQTIAVMGSSGESTGSHLSFWLRLNGNRLDGTAYQFAA
ncbi:MAG: peptidoglycan DD-metalloendopeptidase family protein [Oscillospiraceae bacterium]|jgi:beta-lactamase regulating signal transducer with metallopeptidase domain|nr:peptidoglycan DD-metalloendopeptidase family protein [Oscillospiraceae bacterium]